MRGLIRELVSLMTVHAQVLVSIQSLIMVEVSRLSAIASSLSLLDSLFTGLWADRNLFTTSLGMNHTQMTKATSSVALHTPRTSV